jgi:hypothetical protein
MYTCPPNLPQFFLTLCKIIIFKVDEKGFSPRPEGDNRVLEAQKTIHSRYGL